MTTPIFITGFETGAVPSVNGGVWSNVTGSPTVTSTNPNTGTYALNFNVTAAIGRAGKDLGSASYVQVARFYVRLNSLPSEEVRLFLMAKTAGSTNNIYFGYSNTQNKFFVSTGGTYTYSANTISAGQYYLIDLRGDSSGANTIIDWSINGTSQTQGSVAVTADTQTGWRLGNNDAKTWNANFDDLVISVTSADYPIGPGGTELIKPSADGTHNITTGTLQNQAGADINGSSVFAYSLVNSVPMGDATTYVQQAGASTTEYAEVQFGDIQSTHSAILGAMAVLVYKSASATTNNGGCIVSKDNFSTSTTLWGAPGALSDYSESSNFWKSAIISGVTDDTTVNAIRARMGYASDATPDPYWIDLGVEVGYKVSTGYTLAISSTSYSYTPQSLTALAFKRILGISNTNFIYTTQNINLVHGYILGLLYNSLSLSTQNINLLASRKLVLSATNYSETPQSISLNLARILGLNSSSFSVSAGNISILRSILLGLQSQTYSATAQNIFLEFDRILGISSASYALTTQSINLTKSSAQNYTLQLLSTVFNLVGQQINTQRGYAIQSSIANYAATSQNINFLRGLVLGISPTYYTATGIGILLTKTGSYILYISPSQFTVSAQNINLLRDYLFTINKTDYSASSQAVGLNFNRILSLNQAQYLISTQNISLTREFLLPISTTNFAVSTQNVSLLSQYLLTTLARTYSLVGKDIIIIYNDGSNVLIFPRRGNQFSQIQRLGTRSARE